MTNEKQFLLDMLKAFIHEEKLNFDTELDRRELMRLSAIHSVMGIFSCMVQQSPCEQTEQLAEKLEKLYLTNLSMYTQRSEKADKMLETLSEAGIDHMVAKGYVVRRYYPIPELRSYGDIDILIRPADREKCHKLLLEQDFEVKDDWEPVYSYRKGVEIYEIHTEIMEIDISDKADYRGFFRTAWENVQSVGGRTYEPTPEFHFLYLLTHIAKHLCGAGAGIRMYMDIAVFVKHFGSSIDWAYIDAKLEELKLKDFANTALTVVERYFGVPSPLALRSIPEETLEDFMNFTLDGGIFGQCGRDSGLIALKNSEDKTRTATVMRRVFPSAESIERRYTYLQGRHWLLPVAWVHRVFKNRDIWWHRAAEVKSIMQTDEEKVQKLKQIYRDIGL